MIGPNGCTCGYNGDCNCPFVPSAASDATGHGARCGHGKAPNEWCETCDGDARDDDQEGEDLDECTCARGPFDRSDDVGFPCDCCGRIVR